MSIKKEPIAEQVHGERKLIVNTSCTLSITDHSNVDADTGNFIFRNSGTGHEQNVKTHGFASGTTAIFPFDWPYEEPWDQYTGLVNFGDGGVGYWCWGCNHVRSTDAFPSLEVAMD